MVEKMCTAFLKATLKPGGTLQNINFACEIATSMLCTCM